MNSNRSEEHDLLAASFAPEPGQVDAASVDGPWKVLLVDDQEDVHAVLHLTLHGVLIEGRRLLLLDALSASEAKAAIVAHPDIALILLDVVMESDQAGLDLVRHIRDELSNRSVQIVLITGQPGYAPQREVISGYEIDGYRLKSELSANQIFVQVYSAIRTYRLMREHEILQQDLEQKVNQLKRSNAELEQFSYAISHDLRQPLRMISSYMQLLGVSLADQLGSEQRAYFNFAINGAKRLDRMLVDLLEYSRVGRLGEPPEWLESRLILDDALLFLQPALLEAQANLRIGGQWPRVFVSPDEILRLLQNLIGNAAKFRNVGQVLEISVFSKVSAGNWFICIADNGIGIHPGQIARLFQVFQRLHSRAAFDGSGVGLALCRKIAEHHGGRIWAESAGEGRGSRFCVSLPLPLENA
ncbi:MAG: ATP-binding protein [Accumulibacter sp.]|jgi:signal transduction histidine kinase|uniref:sensor histidine kinase n=1 Tax=Accumulibacter sp. TaxID=2053492 RepID=UPI002FC388F0